MKSFRIILIMSLVFRCASHRAENNSIIIQSSELEKRLSTEPKPEYQLGYGDVIEVKFFNNNQFNEQLIVRPDGRISMERVGDIIVSGLTPKQLSRKIEDAYGTFIKEPEVTVIVREFGGSQVYVLGEVEKPGAYPVHRKLSVIQSIAMAGGYKATAKLKSVILIRKTQAGVFSARRLNLSGLSAENIKRDDITVESLDIIYIPKTFIANVNTFIDQAFSGFIQPLDVYLRAVWYYR